MVTDPSSEVESFYRLWTATASAVLQTAQGGIPLGATPDQFDWRLSQLNSILIVGELARRRIRATPEHRDAIVREGKELLAWHRQLAESGPASYQLPPYPIVPLGEAEDAELEQRWANLMELMLNGMTYGEGGGSAPT
jgi:hypothetical protein